MLTGLQIGSTVLSLLWIPAITIAVSGTVIAISRRQDTDREVVVNRLLVVWLIAAIAAAAVLTLQPGPHAFDGARPAILNPISRLDVRDAVANVLLYVPVGFFAAILWRSRRRPIAWAGGLALTLSLTIEFAQFVLPIDRAATTHDVVFNTLGGFVGAVVGVLVVGAASSVKRLSPGEMSDE